MRRRSRHRKHDHEGRIFKAYRIRANITQSELGKDLDIPLPTIRDYEQGRCLPSGDRMILIMERLGIPASELGEKLS